MTLEDNLSERLIDPRKAAEIEDNYKPLLEGGHCERNIGYEIKIKLARLEERDTVRECRQELYFGRTLYHCARCGRMFEDAVKITRFCDRCGQRLR